MQGEEGIRPRKLGYSLHPPSIILVYESGGDNRLRRRIVKLKHLDADKVADEILKGEHKKYFQVHRSQIIRLVTQMQSDSNEVDLNKVSTSHLQKAKEDMDAIFEKTRIKPHDPRFQYDLRKDFGEPSEPSGWDSDE